MVMIPSGMVKDVVHTALAAPGTILHGLWKRSPPTSDDIEMRLCSDNGYYNEDSPFETLEIYVQWPMISTQE